MEGVRANKVEVRAKMEGVRANKAGVRDNNRCITMRSPRHRRSREDLAPHLFPCAVAAVVAGQALAIPLGAGVVASAVLVAAEATLTAAVAVTMVVALQCIRIMAD
jgi:hypothetical protein